MLQVPPQCNRRGHASLKATPSRSPETRYVPSFPLVGSSETPQCLKWFKDDHLSPPPPSKI